MNSLSPALQYHRLTVHPRPVSGDPRLVRGYRPLMPERKPPPFKSYPGLEMLPLPDELAAKPGGTGLDLAAFARLLFLSGGVVRVMDLGGEPLWFRAAGSAGNLSPVELYLVSGDMPGLAAGIYHYAPVEHALVRLGDVPAGTAPAVVLTGIPWRTGWKYTERGWRHLWWDAGTLLAHALAVCEEAGWPARVHMGFVDEQVAALVGAQAPHELPLAVLALGDEAWQPPEPSGAEVPAGQIAADPLEFPLVTSTHRSGDLGGQDRVEQWRAAARAFGAAPATERPGWALPSPVSEVVLARGSTRRFDRSRWGPNGLLVDAMAWATTPVPGDFVADGCTWLEHYLGVHAVEGVEPGAYRFAVGRLEPLRQGDIRAPVRHLCLDQALGGDGAYTAFHCADLDGVTSTLGSRGYRAAQLEAGIVEGRLHLAAFAMGFGATGLTFYDDEVSHFFGTPASPLLVTAVGAPAYRSRPGGPPRHPTVLRPPRMW